MNRKDKAKTVKKSVIEVNNPQGYMIPNAINAKDFARSRMNEINLITKELEQAKYSSTRRVFQQLPRHMRRRAASYNIKRLPTRLRMRAIEEMKNDTPKGKCSKKMKNCRRWRRRSSNVTSEFKAKKGWLETHLWHAKRCKMIDYWGFKIAAHLNEKCLKSCYRSSCNGVLLHDFSYWQPFWMDSCNLDKLARIYQSVEQVFDITIEHDGVHICPIKIIKSSFNCPLLFLHPAAISTGILNHHAFKKFLEDFEISLSDASADLCTFKLHGPKSESVLSQFCNLKSIDQFPLKVQLSDPRCSNPTSVIVTDDFDTLFKNSSLSIKTDKEICIEKSNLLLPEALNANINKLCLSVSKAKSEYYLICPRKWARIIWYNLIKTKPVKVAGIEQIDVISFENEIPIFPRDYVKSPAYESWSEKEKCRLEDIYNRKPPAKRLSYQKLGIESPFKSNFSTLGPLRKAFIEIEGKGVIKEFAEIYTNDKIFIGFATTVSNCSLKKGRSIAIASVSSNFSMESSSVLIRNYCSPDTFRNAKLKFL